jgi:hypothetical protein
MTITCIIKYKLDPFKTAQFEKYAQQWLTTIPECGGNLLGYFMPHEGTNDVAMALVSFDTLASYEAYKARLKTCADAVANFQFAQNERFILSEERSFLRNVEPA